MATLISFLMIAQPALAQCSVPGCDAATAEVARGKSTAAAILTASAPTATQMPPTATQTPAPTSTPWPTDTPMPSATPTMTPQPPTVAPIVATAAARTIEQPTATPAPATDTARSRSTVGDDLLLVSLIVGLIVAGGLLYLWYARRKGWMRW